MKITRMEFEDKLREILASSEEIGTVETCRKYSVSTGTFYRCEEEIWTPRESKRA